MTNKEEQEFINHLAKLYQRYRIYRWGHRTTFKGFMEWVCSLQATP